MKENIDRKKESSHYNLAAEDPKEDIRWFEQFDNAPGIYDVFNEKELATLKHQMLLNIKAEINKQD